MENRIECENCNFEFDSSTYPDYCPNCGYGYNISLFEKESIQRRILAEHSKDDFSSFVNDAGPREKPKDWMLKREYITPSLLSNHLYHFIKDLYGDDKVDRVIAKYRLETHTKDDFKGAAIFYQFDKDNQCHAFKVIQYDENGHRITGDKRTPKNEKDLFYQKPLMGKGNYCLFGRHLLNMPDAQDKPICIVESEKTAIIASIVYPEAIWMATGSCYYLYNNKIMDFVNDRKIILFPDVDVKYEPIDIDEETGTIKCINWYLIKDNPHGKGLHESGTISVSGFLESFIKRQCENCSNRKNCSSSPYYSLKNGNEPYKIENRKMGFKLDAYPTITEIPKVVLDKLSDVSCEFRGWDLGDYILWCKQNNQELKSFDELISPIEQNQIDSINQITSELENQLNFNGWEVAISKGITELPKEQKENTKDGDKES